MMAELPSEDVTVHLEGSFEFVCTSCGGEAEKPADHKILALLLATDVVVVCGDWDVSELT
jgi:hypothetical protein